MTQLLNRYFVTFAIALSGTITGCASGPEKPDASEQEPQSIEAASTTDWLNELPTTLSSDLCAENEIFRSCFSVSEDECHQRTQAIAASCEIQYHAAFPTIESDSQASQAGGSIGECTGNKLYQNLEASFPLNETESCKRILDET